MKQEKLIHFIVQQSRHRKDNKSSETKSHPPQQSKKLKTESECKHTKC